MKGGYQVDSRVETVKDEIVMEVVELVRGPDERRADGFREIAKLGLKYLELLQRVNGGGSPSLAFM